MKNTQKIQIDFDLFMMIIGLLKTFEPLPKNDETEATYNLVFSEISEKLKSMKARETYQLYQEAKNNGDKILEQKYLKEYNSIKNS